jgi:hypothetical protein
MKKSLTAFPSPVIDRHEQQPVQPAPIAGLALCAIAFIFCILVGIAPLNRMGSGIYFQNSPLVLLTSVGSWLPVDLHLAAGTWASQLSTHMILYFVTLAPLFAIYGISAWLLWRQASPGNDRRMMQLIWLGALIAGLIYVLTPALFSHDIFAYASYGRLLVVYHANPYFTMALAYPHDPLFEINDWSMVPSAYGPFWTLINALSVPFGGANPTSYIFFYRLLGLASHLCNILLITAILSTMGRSQRIVTLGTQLYAWNPLALLESGLNGHNDLLMVTFILLGLLLWLRVERKGDSALRPRGYLPPLIAFALATMIKLTGALFIALFLILLARKALYPASSPLTARGGLRALQWRSALRVIIPAAIVSMGLILVSYVPFWIGHSPFAILLSFIEPPASHKAYGSILFAVQQWIIYNDLPAQPWLATPLYILSLHITWTVINIIVVAATMIVGVFWLWRAPTTRTLALAALIVLGALVLVTPWFFPWYILWFLGLAIICLPDTYDHLAWTLAICTLIYSASSFFVYFYKNNQPPIGGWIGMTWLTTIGPPLLALLILLVLPALRKGRTSRTTITRHD